MLSGGTPVAQRGEMEGPGRLTSALGIGRDLNGKAAEPRSGLWFEDRGTGHGQIVAPRIGGCLRRSGMVPPQAAILLTSS